MASHRLKSPSTPSEGEIIESGSETKATTSKTPLNGTSVDRHTRASISSAPRSRSRSRSPASLSSSRSPRRRRSRSRSRSRSSYRDYNRGYKRRRDDDFYDDRRYHRQDPRYRAAQRYDDRFYNRGQPNNRRSQTYYDYDREEGYGGGLKYTDDYDRHEDKRHRTRSRSPYREVRKPRQYSGDEWDSGKDVNSNSRGSVPIVAQVSRENAETQDNQVQQTSSDTASRVVDE